MDGRKRPRLRDAWEYLNDNDSYDQRSQGKAGGLGLRATEWVIHGVKVIGVGLDEQSRCRHWNSPWDIVAIQFPCCETFFACYECHREAADHEAAVWPRSEFGRRAVLCGACGHRLSVEEYLASNDRCPRCGSGFNPGCRLHRSLYFDE